MMDQQQQQQQQQPGLLAASVYGDVFTKVFGDGPAPMLASFPQAPTSQSSSDGHIQTDVEGLLCSFESYIRVKTIWASDFLMARFVPRIYFYDFQGLQHLHLRRCPSLRFALAMGRHPSLPSLETLHIIHCGDLRHIFLPWDQNASFPKLTTIHLHDLPALQQICGGEDQTPAPALETIRIRGCPNLRRLPSLMGRKPGTMKPAVEVEKDVWDALEWDGMHAGHHPSLYETPVHSRYYKRRMLRGTVLR